MTTTGRRLPTLSNQSQDFKNAMKREDIETWMACDTEECGFQMLNDDEIVTSFQETDSIDDETDVDKDNNESSKGSSNADTFSALETAM
ncbi:uncharacterized protein TNCV_3024401 [Trichonephila clavipes]|nr:uncharacterized protein TNCV_3024401 [Trichonephila clavipes]